MKKPLIVVVVVLSAAGGYWAGRGARPAGLLDASSSSGPIVARFAGHALRASDVQARVAALPEMVRARLSAPEARRQLVEELVREQVLARLAEEKGYQRDPELARRWAEEFGRFYVEKEFEEPERRKAPGDEELRRYFDEHRAELSRPERVRVALIAFKVASAAEREKKRALARATLAEARAGAKDYYAFGNLARARSEDERTRASSGEIGYASREDLERGYGAELARAAFELKASGELRSAPVESADALYLVKLVGRESAYEPRFEAVRDTLQARLGGERRNADRRRFLDQVWKQADVKIDEEAVRALDLGRASR
jgi:peptidyl-prolyl cis-trans isomerase C